MAFDFCDGLQSFWVVGVSVKLFEEFQARMDRAFVIFLKFITQSDRDKQRESELAILATDYAIEGFEDVF